MPVVFSMRCVRFLKTSSNPRIRSCTDVVTCHTVIVRL
jgi:hypothetical protein